MAGAPALLLAALGPISVSSAPIRLHPENPHYFLFRGNPSVLITSGEHYGAVLNLDFDYVPYLDELSREGLNLTRTFSGAYMEHHGAFGIRENTLAPAEGRLIAPWDRSDQPGYAGGGNKFDLEKWNESYFSRLRDFCRQAGERGIVVEFVLFCPFYGDEQWDLSPMKATNNANGVGDVAREDVYTMRDGGLQRVQEAMVRKVVDELAHADNVYYEICNEPYFGGVTLPWQHRIADVIWEAEAGLPHRHLIAQNIANGSAVVEAPHPAVSILNFHYATPPEAVAQNYGLGRAIADDETGFRGTDDLPYRTEAWHFLMAGGAVFDHLDYSFTATHEDGTFPLPEGQPGGGGRSFRRQMGILKRFVESFNLVRMAPVPDAARSTTEGVSCRALAEPGRVYAVYVEGGTRAELMLDAPEGRYVAEWVNPRTGETDRSPVLNHKGGELALASPPYEEDIALRLVRRD